MTDEPLALRLKRIREEAGLTLQQAAAATGKTLAGYQYYERPERFKKPQLPLGIARALVPASANPAYRQPVLVDGHGASISGTAMASIRTGG